MTVTIDRREALFRLGGLGTVLLSSPAVKCPGTESSQGTGMGLVAYDCAIRRRWMQQQDPEFDLFEPLTFLKHCRKLGAGGMQVRLGQLDADRVRQVREYAEQHSLFLDSIVTPPQDTGDVARFEAEIRKSADAGVQAARTVIMPGRRYEEFSSLEEFKKFERRGRRMVVLAIPVVEKYRVPLAIENHKDQRNDERVALLESVDSEFVGACVDTGNSFALLEDPVETVKALAPWAKTVHLKDQAVQPYGDGFLLGDIPLGQGCFDLPRMVGILRTAQPEIHFSLELITRDALRVPCLTDQFWTTMPKVAGRDLARTTRYVRRHRAKSLQQVSRLPPDRQVVLEDANVAASLEYARETLKI